MISELKRVNLFAKKKLVDVANIEVAQYFHPFLKLVFDNILCILKQILFCSE